MEAALHNFKDYKLVYHNRQNLYEGL